VEDRLAREKEDLQNQLMMVIRMNEELNSSLEETNKNHTDEVTTLRAHLEVLNSELEIFKSKKLSNLKSLDEENLRLEVALDALKEEATSSRTKEEMAKNKLERSQLRLQRVEKELKEEADKVKEMASEISLLKETKDVLESELEATATKVETVWSR
jgi:chromosome segregation ATPase